MFDICFVDGVDDVIEYHVKAENTFNHFIDGMLFGNMLKNHSVHGCYGSCPVAAMPSNERSRGPFRSRMICMAVTRSSSLSNVARVGR